MKIQLLASNGGSHPRAVVQFLTTYLVNDTLAIDAGSLGCFASWDRQQRMYLHDGQLWRVSDEPFDTEIYDTPNRQ